MIREINIIQTKATLSRIRSYLKQNSNIFIPALHPRVDIDEFSKKIFNHGIQYWAMCGEEIAGFMACYFNDPSTRVGYITTISVARDYQGKGIGGRLLDAAIKYCIEKKFERIELEVNLENLVAVRLYKSRGFILARRGESSDFYELNISFL